MKINPKIYNSVTTEPFDVQELSNGTVIELHSLNQNEALFNEYAPKAKFAIWSSVDGKRYKLILEDTYYPRLRELYGRRVNQCMIDFWDAVEKERSKLMKFVFIPVSIAVIVAFILLMIFAQQLGETGQMIAMVAVLVAFIVVNVIVNKKIDGYVNKHNDEAIDKIKKIIGGKRFEELLNEQQAHYDEFFQIPAEEESTEDAALEVNEEVVSEEITEENK
jgi:hypothetical protein